MRMKARVGLLLIATGVVVVAPAAAWAQEAAVSAIDNEFDPAQLDVEAGTTVTWTNDGDAPHTVTASDGSFDSGNLDPGQSFSYTFDQAGEFSYVCEYHEADGMVGAVTVAQADGDGNGGGNGGGNGDEGDGGDDPTTPTEDDEENLPATGPEGLGAFVYLAAVLIGAGAACLYFDRRPVVPQTGSGTQSRVR